MSRFEWILGIVIFCFLNKANEDKTNKVWPTVESERLWPHLLNLIDLFDYNPELAECLLCVFGLKFIISIFIGFDQLTTKLSANKNNQSKSNAAGRPFARRFIILFKMERSIHIAPIGYI